MSQNDSFEQVEKTVEYSLLMLEEVTSIDMKKLDPDARDFLISQLKKTIGKLASIVSR